VCIVLLLLSPSKTLDFSPQAKVKTPTTPDFLEEAGELIERLQKLSAKKIAGLMHVSDKLAAENFERFQNWSPRHTAENSKPCVLAYRGDVYDGLAADNWQAADFKFAQRHLRILSGLYGVLRPLDAIQPYRLEMGTPLKAGRKKDLYAFWQEMITDAIAQALREVRSTTIINLASKEYASAIDFQALEATVITPVFKEYRDGKYKFLSFFGKRARGLMAGYILENKLKKPERINRFDVDGYGFNEELSSEGEWVFTR
jgi:hypothetical protein